MFGAAYTLWMYKRVIFGAVANAHVAKLKDIGAREFLVLAMLALAVLGMGLYPLPFTEVMHASVNELLSSTLSGEQKTAEAQSNPMNFTMPNLLPAYPEDLPADHGFGVILVARPVPARRRCAHILMLLTQLALLGCAVLTL